MNSPFAPTVCPHDCPSACSLEVELLDEKTIGKVHGAKANSYTEGVICSKVSRYAERVHHPDRLTHPLRRIGAKGEGLFAPISWDEALDEVTHNLQRVTQAHGAEAVWPYFYAGTMGQLQRDGINRLRNVMGYSRQKKTICTSIAYSGWSAGVGAVWGSDPRDMAKSDLIVIWGCNAVATQINVMTKVSQAKRERGAKLVVIDPYRTPTAKKADLHLMLKPGTDGALATAVMHLLFAEGYADREYLEKYTDLPASLEPHLESRTPKWASDITGVSEDEIKQFARLFGENRRSYIRLGIGFSRSRNGAHNVHAVSALPAITGAWQHEGGGALLGTSGLFHLDKRLIEGLDRFDPSVRELDMSRIGSILCGDKQDLAGGPPVNALFTQSCNPMTVAPDHTTVRRGFEREDLFVCVHEQFMTETAAMADIVLPATTFLEHDDLYLSYGQVHMQLGCRVIEPLAECRSNHQVICDLAKRLGAEHLGFTMSAEELIDTALQQSGYPGFEALREQRWLDCSKTEREMNFLDGFGWPDGRFRFQPDWKVMGDIEGDMPKLPDYWEAIDQVSDEYPLRLITPTAKSFLNTSFTETPGARRREAGPQLLIHSDDAATAAISDGDLVLVGSQRGEIKLTAVVTSGIASGVLVVEGIWPGRDFDGGLGINTLTSAEAAMPDGGAVFHDTAVWVRRCSTSS
ncbi:MAG: molybdopterin oxidoreductase family protein [Sedimenticola sp.]